MPPPRFEARRARGVIHEDPAHQIRGEPEEVRAALPVHRLLIHEPHERFVHERRALDRVIRPFAAQMALGEGAQLLINEPGQLAQRSLIATAPAGEQLRDRLIRTLRHR